MCYTRAARRVLGVGGERKEREGEGITEYGGVKKKKEGKKEK